MIVDGSINDERVVAAKAVNPTLVEKYFDCNGMINCFATLLESTISLQVRNELEDLQIFNQEELERMWEEICDIAREKEVECFKKIICTI